MTLLSYAAADLTFLLELPKPDQTTREEIFKIHTENKPLADDVDLKELVRETEGKVGSDIEFICKRASILAIREFLSQSTEHRTQITELKISKGILKGP